MSEFIQKYYIDNNLQRTTDEKISIDETNVVIIYEVLRVMKKLPLFLDEHIERLYITASLRKIELHISKFDLYKKILHLIEINSVEDGNIKINIICNVSWQRIVLGFIPHFYPQPELYTEGVKTALFYATRLLPNAKIQDSNLRTVINNYLKDNKLYEVLLVDANENITEGSKSNIFFISDNKLYTAPDEQVLKGITRKKVIEICHRENICLSFEAIKAERLGCFDAAFITGTSPKILPIKESNSFLFNTENKLLKHIIELYELLLK